MASYLKRLKNKVFETIQAARTPGEAQIGSALLIAVLLICILAIVPVAIQFSTITYQKTKLQVNVNAQAENAARAGLVDAISWFRRQTTQPVRQTASHPYPDAAFAPQYSSNSATSDTIDASIGLVKEYQLTDDNKLWARYEVRKQTPSWTSTSDPNYNSKAVHDITESRVQGYSNGSGLVWYLESTGYVYRRDDSSAAYNTAPNQVIAKTRVSTEIRRITITLPANCAVVINNRGNVTMTSNSRITGNTDVGLGYYTNGSASISGSTISGSPAVTSVYLASYPAVSGQNIFGVNENEFKLVADVTCSTMSELSSDYPSMAVVYIKGNANFDANHQLRGGGILYVSGNLTMDAGSNTYFSGLIYVTGNATIYGPASINGSLVVEGSLTMNGMGDAAEVAYDGSIISSVRQQVTQYRENKSTFFTFSGLKE
jgi:hypothetical protein